jgi:hypothetical protein
VLVAPILKMVFDILDIMWWTHVWWSGLMFALFLFLTFNRDLIPFFSHFPWIYYMSKGFFKVNYKKYQDLSLLEKEVSEEHISHMSRAETKELKKEMANHAEKEAEPTIESSLGTIGTISNMV